MMVISETAVRKALLVLVVAVAFAGLWMLLAPFYGPPGTATSSKTLNLIAFGERGLCRPPALGIVGASLSDGDAIRRSACQEVGIGRWETGWMLLWTAGAMVVATSVFLKIPQSDPQADEPDIASI